VRALRTINAVMPYGRAKMFLEMWVRQERGRAKKLGGELHRGGIDTREYYDDPNNPDPGQIVPEECERPKPKRKKKVAALLL
jgi:hypothetical protein